MSAQRKPFQEATVAHVLTRLRAMKSSKRFLVADEVGLGKTLIAQGVLEQLTKRAPHAPPPVVVYMCSNRTIAEQNRTALLSMIPTKEERELVTVRADRLGLVPAAAPPPADARFLFYALTPSITSGEGTGRVDERALLVKVLREVSSTLRSRWAWKSHLQDRVRNATWEDALARIELRDTRVCQRFRTALCCELELSLHARDTTLAKAIEDQLAESPFATIETMRRAMTFAVLGTLQPDVVILDEFQRFFEFLPKPDEATLAEEENDDDANGPARRVMKALLEGLGRGGKSAKRPYVLMLSATPYRLYSRALDGKSHHNEFYELLDFLYDDGGHSSRAIKEDFSEHGERLLSDDVGSTRAAAVRERLEQKLLDVMCRTERDALSRSTHAAPTSLHPTKLEPADIRSFRLLSEIAVPTRLSAEPYWSSIPYAFQAMDEKYALREKGRLPPARPGDGVTRLDFRSVRQYTAPLHGYPHPRLRKLIEVVAPARVALPWLPPTKPWWELGGPFASAAGATKTLVFSRYRAVPRILSAVLSYEAEKHVFAGRRFDYAIRSHGARGREGLKPLEGLRAQPRSLFGLTYERRRGQANRTFAMFAPFPTLARLGDPLRVAAERGTDVTRAEALAHVRKRIEQVLLNGRAPSAAAASRASRTLDWIATLERDCSRDSISWPSLMAALDRWASEREAEGDGGARVCRAFARVAPLPSSETPTSAELDELAEIALTGPGVVLTRAFERVYGASGVDAVCEGERERAVARLHGLLEVGLSSLRAYLDAPEWRELFVYRVPGQRKRRLPFVAALRQAVWDGGLEAVLDELFATYCGFGSPRGDAAADARIDAERGALERLGTALSIHGAQVSIHHLRRKPPSVTAAASFKMRCHATAPLGLTATSTAVDGEAFRSDHLRVAFNSPFRPMALVTTSIGQEGLDFHTYARRIVHWDPPNNPVELEQRDGRIVRFGSHAVRTALAELPWASPLPAEGSPWLAIGAAAREREDDSGIQPWWTTPNAAIERVFIVPSFSRVRADVGELNQALGLYRTVLGQPGQERLLQALQARIDGAPPGDREELRRWYDGQALCLSPFVRNRRVPVTAQTKATRRSASRSHGLVAEASTPSQGGNGQF